MKAIDFESPPEGFRAFTLIELLVVIAIVGMLASLLLPAISRVSQRAQGTYCLNNGKQLMLAVTLYTSDYMELFPPNPDDGNSIPGHNWCSGQAGLHGSAEFNSDILRDPRRSLLSSYLRGDASVFHCPADKRMGLYQGADPARVGKVVPAARTFSLSQAVGTICPGFDAAEGSHSGSPTLPANARWLDNSGSHHRDSPWFTYGKLSTIRLPGPSMLWVLVDESVQGLNDAAFAFGMKSPAWIDAPGTYHNGGCGFSFADGHCENHRWLNHGEKRGNTWQITDKQDQRDWLWMRERTSAKSDPTSPPEALDGF